MNRRTYSDRVWKGMIENCFALVRGNVQSNVLVWSFVAEKEVASSEMFSRTSPRFVVCKREHFPVDPHLKYIQIILADGARKSCLRVEITALDFNLVNQQFEAAPLKGFRLQGKRILFQGEPLLNTRTQQHFRVRGAAVSRPRTVVSTVQPLESASMEPVADFFDMVWGCNLCREKDRPQLQNPDEQRQYEETMSEVASSSGMEMRQVLSMELQQSMEQCMMQDQRPLLLLAQRISARMIQRGEMLQMGQHELREYIDRQASSNPVLETD